MSNDPVKDQVAAARPAPGFLDPLLDDLRARGTEAVPVPRSRLDETLTGVVLPVAGINALLVGLIGLAGVQPPVPGLFLGLIPVAAAALIMLVVRRGGGLGTGTLLSVLLIATATVWPTSIWGVFPVLVLAVALTAAGYLEDWSGVLLTLYIPAVRLYILDVSLLAGVAFAALAMVSLFTIFARRGMKRASVTVLVVALGLAVIESDGADRPLLFASLAALLAAVALIYELRFQPRRQSDLRQFAVQGVMVGLIGFSVTFLWPYAESMIWAWAATNAVVQGVLGRSRPASAATRIGWIAAVVAFAVLDDATLSPDQRALVVLFLAAALHFIAVRLQRRFPSDLGVSMACGIGVWLVSGYQEAPAGVASVVTAALTSTVLVRFGLRSPIPAGPRWWIGFVRPRHAVSIRKALVAVTRPLYQSGVGAVIVSYVRQGYTWLKYLKGPSALGMIDLVLLGGHVLGALTLADQAARLVSPFGPVTGAGLSAGAAIWIAWGVLLVANGSRRCWPLLRLAGFAFIAAPALLYLPPQQDAEFWGIVAAMGTAAWLSSQLITTEPAPVETPNMPDDAVLAPPTP